MRKSYCFLSTIMSIVNIHELLFVLWLKLQNYKNITQFVIQRKFPWSIFSRQSWSSLRSDSSPSVFQKLSELVRGPALCPRAASADPSLSSLAPGNPSRRKGMHEPGRPPCLATAAECVLALSEAPRNIPREENDMPPVSSAHVRLLGRPSCSLWCSMTRLVQQVKQDIHCWKGHLWNIFHWITEQYLPFDVIYTLFCQSTQSEKHKWRKTVNKTVARPLAAASLLHFSHYHCTQHQASSVVLESVFGFNECPYSVYKKGVRVTELWSTVFRVCCGSEKLPKYDSKTFKITLTFS